MKERVASRLEEKNGQCRWPCCALPAPNVHSRADADLLLRMGVLVQVAILCNHQRAVPKGHTGQMQKMEAKLLEHQQQLDALEAELLAAEKGKKYEGSKPRASDMCALMLMRTRRPSYQC